MDNGKKQESESSLSKLFNFDGRTIRTIMINNNPWFVASDVCEVLDIKNNRQACDQLDVDDVSKTYITDNLNRQQEAWIISESGLYLLTTRSNKPEARKFTKWITTVVLPTIRKTGSYSVNSVALPTDPLEIAEMAMTVAKAERARADRLQVENSALKPMADYSKDVLMCQDLICMNIVGAEIGISARKLNQWLNDKNIIYKSGGIWYPVSEWRNLGLFGYHTHRFIDSEGTAHATEYLKVTQRGRMFIVELWHNQSMPTKSTYRRLFESLTLLPARTA